MFARILAILFTWLGIESLLATFCLQYGLVLILIPQSRYDSVLVADLAWQGYGALLGIPFLLKAVFTGFGVIVNLRGHSYSWLLRFIGAFFGTIIWFWMTLKYFSSTATLSFATIISFDCMILSICIMAMAWHDFPEPRSATDARI